MNLNVMLTEKQVSQEITRICEFMSYELNGRDQVVIPVSGGLDSDVVVRLAARCEAINKLKLFIVQQDDMEPRHLKNARDLATDLNQVLVELPLSHEPFHIVGALVASDSDELFSTDGLDAMRMKSSLRTCINSAYQDHGFIVLGTSNRTEYETGFYLPFGDGVAHIKPIQHLYKSQVRQIAQALGTRKEVLEQPASAGFWAGEEDLEDLAWWLFNEGPVTEALLSTEEEEQEVADIKAQLTVEKIDKILLGIARKLDTGNICELTGASQELVDRFKKLVHASAEFKSRGYNKSLSDNELRKLK